MTKKTLDVSKRNNTHWPSLRRLTTFKPPLSGVRYDFFLIMLNFFNREIIGKIVFLRYRYRFLAVYVLIGVTSIVLEILCYFSLEKAGLNTPTSNVLGLMLGVLFAYWMNVRFNFRVPKNKRNGAFVYFILISAFSVSVNFIFKQQLQVLGWSYGSARFAVSGSLFLIGYTLHRKLSFSDYKKVGVAVYTTRHEDIKEIFEKIEMYPDFIHVDVVDDTFVDDAEIPTIHRLEVIRAYWPKKQIHIHLMSKKPMRWIPDLVSFSDVLFVHADIEDDIKETLSAIRSAGKKPGLCISMETSLERLEAYLKDVSTVMVLAISKPGYSGQRFEMNALNTIKTLREWQDRWKFDLCVDGGVNEKNIGLLNVEYVVSGSSIIESPQPHRQIMRLQTQSQYEHVETVPIPIDVVHTPASTEGISYSPKQSLSDKRPLENFTN